MIRWLISSGLGSALEVSSYGYSTLHLACCDGNGEMVAFLLSQGVDVDLQDNEGRTALFVQQMGGKEEEEEAKKKPRRRSQEEEKEEEEAKKPRRSQEEKEAKTKN